MAEIPGPGAAATGLRMHVEDLVAEHLLSVDYLPRATPRADVAGRHIVVRPVLSHASYVTALQQIAAVVAGGQGRRGDPKRLVRSWIGDVAEPGA